jgi:sporulation protein YlmC with PRC-barrel domain
VNQGTGQDLARARPAAPNAIVDTTAKPVVRDAGRVVATARATHFAPGTGVDQYPGYSAEQLLMLPYYSRIMGEGVAQAREDEPTGAYGSLPPGEVGVRRGKRVYATDGEIGRVEGLVIDPRNHQVSHVLLQEGHLFGHREVSIPIGAVTGVVDGVQLNITKQQVENLPPLNVDHRRDSAGATAPPRARP